MHYCKEGKCEANKRIFVSVYCVILLLDLDWMVLGWLTPSEEVFKEYKRGAPNDGFLLNTLKTLFRLSRVLLDFWKRILRYKICTCSVILVEIWVFSKLQGLHYYFPENFRRNLTYYASEKIFLIPLSITNLNPKIYTLHLTS